MIETLLQAILEQVDQPKKDLEKKSKKICDKKEKKKKKKKKSPEKFSHLGCKLN